MARNLAHSRSHKEHSHSSDLPGTSSRISSLYEIIASCIDITPVINTMNRFLCILVLVSSASAFVLPTKNHPSTTSSTALGSEASQRKPWNPFRFLSQSSKFISMPLSPKPAKQLVKPNDRLWPTTAFDFAPLDDVVMGGASASTFSNGVWRGTVTDANNGGFIGIRNTPNFDWDLSNCRGLELTLRKRSGPSVSRFKVGIRDSTDFNGLVWAASFDLPITTTPKKIRVPFDKLKPTQFARVVTGEILNRRNVVGIQLIYSKFEYNGQKNPKFEVGNVDLELLEIRAF